VNPVFADTFYWIALLNPDDPDHDRVTAFDLSIDRPPLVTTTKNTASPTASRLLT